MARKSKRMMNKCECFGVVNPKNELHGIAKLEAKLEYLLYSAAYPKVLIQNEEQRVALNVKAKKEGWRVAKLVVIEVAR